MPNLPTSSAVTTLVLKPDGRFHLARVLSVADAERWAAEGYQVFRLAYARQRWAVNHVNSGKLVADTSTPPNADETPALVPLLLTLKGKS